MKHFVKNLWDLKPNSVPDFIGQRETFQCPHCNREVLVAVPTTSTDWEKVAKQYRAYANTMWIECNLLLSEAGCDTLLQRRLEELLRRCEGSFKIVDSKLDSDENGPF